MQTCKTCHVLGPHKRLAPDWPTGIRVSECLYIKLHSGETVKSTWPLTAALTYFWMNYTVYTSTWFRSINILIYLTVKSDYTVTVSLHRPRAWPFWHFWLSILRAPSHCALPLADVLRRFLGPGSEIIIQMTISDWSVSHMSGLIDRSLLSQISTQLER